MWAIVGAMPYTLYFVGVTAPPHPIAPLVPPPVIAVHM